MFIPDTLKRLSRVAFACIIAVVVAPVFSFLRDVFFGPTDMRSQQLATAEKPLHAVKSFSLRILRRERPRLEAGWRMCPSI